MNYKNQQHFNEMMQDVYENQQEKLAGQPDGHEGEPQREVERGGSMLKTDPGYEMVNQPKHYDSVNEPSHYDIINLTVNQIIEKSFTHDEYMGGKRQKMSVNGIF